MLLIIAIALAILWLLGLIGHVAGGLIHVLLLVAVIVLAIHIITGRHSTAG